MLKVERPSEVVPLQEEEERQMVQEAEERQMVQEEEDILPEQNFRQQVQWVIRFPLMFCLIHLRCFAFLAYRLLSV